MERPEKRRSSILKQKQPFAGSSQESGDTTVTTSTTALIKRRVSFHNMRTVQEYDKSGADIACPPQNEPIKLGDTGSSDGLMSAQSSITTVAVTHLHEEEVTEFTRTTGFNRSSFAPENTSTPKPRTGLCIREEKIDATFSETLLTINEGYIPLTQDDSGRSFRSDATRALFAKNHSEQAVKDECLDSEPMDISETASIIGTTANNTHALFAGLHRPNEQSMDISKEGSVKPEETFAPDATLKLVGRPKMDDKTEQTLTMRDEQIDGEDDDETRNVFGPVKTNQEDVLTDGPPSAKNQCGLTETGEVEECDTPSHPVLTNDDTYHVVASTGNSEEQEKAVETVSNARGDTLSYGEQLEPTTNSDSRTSVPDEDAVQHCADAVDSLQILPHRSSGLGVHRTADSPLAVLKKKTRLESPQLRDNSLQSRISFNKSHDTTTRLQYSVYKDLSQANASGLESSARIDSAFISPDQAVARVRRRLRQSLDQSGAWPTMDGTLLGSPVMLLQDISKPNAIFSSPTLNHSGNGTEGALLYSSYGLGRNRVLEPSFVDDSQPPSEILRSILDDTQMLTCRFDDTDFSIRVQEAICFQSSDLDCAETKMVKKAVRSGIRNNFREVYEKFEESLMAEVDEMAKSNRRLALCIGQLNPRKLSRKEAQGFEATRLLAQSEWYLLRADVAEKAKAKTDAMLQATQQIYEERKGMLEKLKLLDEARKGKEIIRNHIKCVKEFLELHELRSKKPDLKALKDEASRVFWDNIQKEMELARIEAASFRKEAEYWLAYVKEVEAKNEKTRKKKDEVLRFYEEEMAKLSLEG